MTNQSLTIRRADDRGQRDHGWLQTAYSFSFGDYHDPAHMGFRALRVINEDHVAPSQGFGTHPHRDMEILTWILSGTLEHRDSMGTGSQIRPGEMQRMTAGTGVTHSELNPSADEEVHLLQIWILPEQTGLEPSYEQREFPLEERRGTLRLLASHDARDGSVRVHQDLDLYGTALNQGQAVRHEPAAGRHAWVQVARGDVVLNGEPLGPGDGAAVTGPVELEGGANESEVLLFDLA